MQISQNACTLPTLALVSTNDVASEFGFFIDVASSTRVTHMQAPVMKRTIIVDSVNGNDNTVEGKILRTIQKGVNRAVQDDVVLLTKGIFTSN